MQVWEYLVPRTRSVTVAWVRPMAWGPGGNPGHDCRNSGDVGGYFGHAGRDCSLDGGNVGHGGDAASLHCDVVTNLGHQKLQPLHKEAGQDDFPASLPLGRRQGAVPAAGSNL